ncbi:hypothetical protein ACIRJS_39905 [Streptomyces sp. NPDC102340]|uniref:hypothetical protein n=1 Tax=unclassified Streptomyces TaxID=2593676 RepID=UPI003813699A
MSRAARRGFRFNPVHLAGWLFADMLLVLALVSMGDRGDPLAATATRPTPGATSPSSPKPTPTGARSVERKPVKIDVRAADGATDAMVTQLKEKTERYEGRTAAFVITFGNAPETTAGQAYAKEINKALKVAQPDMFRGATTRNFWSGGPAGSADLEIYFFTR